MPRARVNDIDLYYEIAGQGQPVLFIHGLGSSTRDWEYQTAFFARYFQTITIDLRGHGQSEKPRGPYAMSQFAADTAALIQQLGVVPVHVVGLSLGGMVAFQLAVDVPDLVRSLVIINSGPEIPAYTFRQRLGALKNYIKRVLIVRLAGMRKMGETLATDLLSAPEQAELRRVFVERWAENDPSAYLAALRAIGGWNVSAHLPALSVPTLIVSADQDYTPVAFKQQYAAQMPRAELFVVRDSRHMTSIERPQALNAALMAFLAKQ